jgi:hypothetical protein
MTGKPLQIYMGHDLREQMAYDVARESIRKRSSGPLGIMPLMLKHLEGILTRPIEERDGRMWDPISEAPMSTEFAISRFCVPFLQKSGWALFVDCDIICWSDIAELFALADDKYAVMVVKHGHIAPILKNTGPAVWIKMDGQAQSYYERKNWSSVVLWNCGHPANKRLTQEALNGLPGRDLHAFCWLRDDQIGELPQEWNWLVLVTPGEPEKKGIWHYTLGGPWFEGFGQNRYDEAWLEEAGKEAICQP